MDHQKSTILLIFSTLSLGGCGGHPMRPELNLKDKSQMSTTNEYPDTFKSNLICIFHDHTQKLFFSKHKNKAKFKCLDDSEVLSSDFTSLKTSAASMTSMASTALVASMTSTASFHQKIY